MLQAVAACREEYMTSYVPEMDRIKADKAAKEAKRQQVRHADKHDQGCSAGSVLHIGLRHLRILGPEPSDPILRHCPVIHQAVWPAA